MYTDFKSLRKAYDNDELSVWEYQKYFSGLFGTVNPGYPDFSDQYVNSVCKAAKPDRKDAPSQPRWIIVVFECNTYGEIVRPLGASSFRTKTDAMSFLNRKQQEGGRFITSSSLVSEYRRYDMFKEDKLQ